jgi:hypothetical protein
VHVPAPGEAGIFGVLGYHSSSLGEVFHRMTKQACVGHAISVVGEEPDPRFEEFIEMRQRIAGPAHGDGPRRHNLDQACLAAAVGHEAGEVAGVDGRAGVRHRYHRGVAAGGGSSGSRPNIFFPFKARLPQVAVQIYKARAHQRTSRIEVGFCLTCRKAVNLVVSQGQVAI